LRYFFIFFFASALHAAEPIFNDYSGQQNIWSEFRNLYAAQGIFRLVTSTPPLANLKDGEMVVYSSGTYQSTGSVHMILRLGTTLYYSPNFRLMTGR